MHVTLLSNVYNATFSSQAEFMDIFSAINLVDSLICYEESVYYSM